MAGDIRITGLEQLQRLARDLKGADKVMRRELLKGLNRATEPAKEKVKADIPQFMPSGYAPLLPRRLKMRTRPRRGQSPSVSITGNISRLDAGSLHHPVYGHPPWVNQPVRPGVFSKPLEQSAPIVRPEILKATNDAIKQIESGK